MYQLNRSKKPATSRDFLLRVALLPRGMINHGGDNH